MAIRKEAKVPPVHVLVMAQETPAGCPNLQRGHHLLCLHFCSERQIAREATRILVDLCRLRDIVRDKPGAVPPHNLFSPKLGSACGRITHVLGNNCCVCSFKMWLEVRREALSVHTRQWVFLFAAIPTWSSCARVALLTPRVGLIVRHCAVT